jgi:endonuclease/exonuclease/phosphatase family metal-dependent hydrolase
MQFRIATYNIHKCRGLDWKESPARVLSVINEVAADVIALQEIFANQVSYFCNHLQVFHYFGVARKLAGREYGNVLFSRFPLAESRSYDLTVKRREPRQCLRTDLNLEADKILHIFAVHLGTSFFERRHQAQKLLSPEILRDPTLNGPRILLGDFNEWTRGRVTQALSQDLQSADLRLHAGRRRTYPGVLPFWHLDHVYYDKELQLNRFQIHKTQISLIASDHLPLVAEFKL